MPINDVTGTGHDGLCENCDTPLTHDNLVEGDLGFYCCKACLMAVEADHDPGPKREDFHSDG